MNLLWSWDDEIRVIFRRLDRELWEETYQNPVCMLGTIAQERLDELSPRRQLPRLLRREPTTASTTYLRETTVVGSPLHRDALSSPTSRPSSASPSACPSTPGGLGVLAGDHLKSASDLGVPLVGVGLLYQQGYFRQYLDRRRLAAGVLPDQRLLQPARSSRSLDADGAPVRVERRHAGPTLVDRRSGGSQVGRVPLFLLDTNLPENPPPTCRTSPTSSTAATRRCASARRSCWASAACARCDAIGLAARPSAT